MKRSLAFQKKFPFLLVLILILIGSVNVHQAWAQLQEPEVAPEPDPRTPHGQGLDHRWGINVHLNNFGFGLTGEYARVLGPFTELTIKTGVTGLRDGSEQTFQDFFTGRNIIPNKFNRALGFPILAGIKRRVFANSVADNFRFFTSASVGPSFAFVYPYLDDQDGNGFRTSQVIDGFLVPIEPINDFFSGWSEGSFEFGGTGEFKIGVDFGEEFNRQFTIEFGYFFYYYPDGIQMLEPGKAARNENGQLLIDPQTGRTIASDEPGFDDQKFFGSPQLSFTFGGFW